MPDMLVKLYQRPSPEPILQKIGALGISIRRPQPYERQAVRRFVEQNWTEGWADEVMVAFTHQPITAFIAVSDGHIVGFAAYECTRRDYFGPTGVLPELRGKGIGLALFLMSLQGLEELGYAYAIVGGAGPVDFYSKAAGAEVIENSVPGIYTPLASAEQV